MSKKIGMYSKCQTCLISANLDDFSSDLYNVFQILKQYETNSSSYFLPESLWNLEAVQKGGQTYQMHFLIKVKVSRSNFGRKLGVFTTHGHFVNKIVHFYIFFY